MPRAVGLVIRCRAVVGAGVNAEERKVTGMAWPHPVVGISPKLADGRRRSPHKTHIVKSAGHDHKIAVAIVESLDARSVGCAFGGVSFDALAVGFKQFLFGLGTHARGDAFVHFSRDIVNAHNKGGGQPRVGQFILVRGGPKSVL